METCRYCHAPIIWARTHASKLMPVDPDEHEDGNIMLTRSAAGTPQATVLGPGDMLFMPDGATRHMPHFATCPNYDPKHQTVKQPR